MFLFPHETKTVTQAVRAGRSVSISAPAGMGSSTLLDRVGAQLRGEGFLVLAFRGLPSVSGVELLSLQQAGFDFPPQATRSLSSMIDSVSAELASQSLGAILLDDVETIDRSTLSVVQAAAARTGTPIVHSRRSSFETLLRKGVRLSAFSQVQVVLKPLDFVSVSALIQDELGGTPDIEIVSRVYGRSGGVTGLVLAIVEGARDADLIGWDGTRWTMRGTTLWTSAISAWLEAKLSQLDADEYEHLRHLAVAHATPNQGICTRLTEAQLNSLEGQGFLTVVSHPLGARYTLLPPVLGTELRGSVGGATKLALEQEPEGLRPEGNNTTELGLDVASFVTHSRDKLGSRLLLQKAAWEEQATVSTAVSYLQSLMQAPRTERTVAAVLEATDLGTASAPEDLFNFLFLRELWLSNQNAATFPTPKAFHELVTRFPSWADAASMFSAAVSTGPNMTHDHFAVGNSDEILKRPGGVLTASAYAFGCLVAGDFNQARTWSSHVPSSELSVVNQFRGFVTALTEVADGNRDRALNHSTDQIYTAIERGDISGVMLHSYAAALALLGLARWQEALEVIDRALAFGPSGVINSGLYRVLLYMASFINFWLRNARLADLFRTQASELMCPDQRLPGMQKAIGDVLERLIHDDPIGAMERLRALVEHLIARNNRFAASMTLWIGLAVWPELKTLELYDSMQSANSEETPVLSNIVSASFDGRQPLVQLVQQLPSDHPNLPLAALVLAARLRQERPSSDLYTTIGAALKILQDQLGATVTAPENASGLSTASGSPDLLSKRELEIARLSRGNSNAAIAARLSLSVRTVESHIRNALKKTGASSRQELFGIVDDTDAD